MQSSSRIVAAFVIQLFSILGLVSLTERKRGTSISGYLAHLVPAILAQASDSVAIERNELGEEHNGSGNESIRCSRKGFCLCAKQLSHCGRLCDPAIQYSWVCLVGRAQKGHLHFWVSSASGSCNPRTGI